jgi:hypothetical protein
MDKKLRVVQCDLRVDFGVQRAYAQQLTQCELNYVFQSL